MGIFPQTIHRYFLVSSRAAGVPVNAVYQRRGKGVLRFRVVFAFVVQIVLHPGNEGIKVVVFVRVDDQPRLFIQ